MVLPLMVALDFVFVNLSHAQLPTSLPDYSFFESSSITLQLPHSKLSVLKIYRLPSLSTFSKPHSVFLGKFNSFLSFTAIYNTS